MQTKLIGTGMVVGLVIAAGACSRTGEGLPAAGKPPVAVEVATVATGEVVNAVDVVGTLRAKTAAEVRSEVTAIVEEVFVTEWVRVSAGQPLARLGRRDGEATVAAARAALAQAEVAETRAVRELERATRLKQEGLMTQQGLDDAASARDAATASVAAARAQLEMADSQLTKTVIRAPLDGVVSLRGINVGDRVENMGGDPMFQIVDNRVMELEATVPSTRSANLAVGQQLTFTVDALPGRTFSGEVKHINPVVEPGSRSLRLVADLANPSGELRGGMFAQGHIVTGSRPGVVLIPRSALTTWDLVQGQAEVLVVSGDVAERRQIRTGVEVNEAVEVTEGLAAGERVVTRGGFNLRSGDRVKVAGEVGV